MNIDDEVEIVGDNRFMRYDELTTTTSTSIRKSQDKRESKRQDKNDADDERQIRWLSLNANISFLRPKCTQIVETNIVIIYFEI